jgi:hypothetical protein
MSSAVCHAVWYKHIDISENSAASHDISARFNQPTQHDITDGKNFQSPPLESQILCKLFLSQCILRNHYNMEHYNMEHYNMEHYKQKQLQFLANCFAFWWVPDFITGPVANYPEALCDSPQST